MATTIEDAAAHEAGHCVVALATGVELKGISAMSGSHPESFLDNPDQTFSAEFVIETMRRLEARLTYLIAVGGFAGETTLSDAIEPCGAADDLMRLRQAGLSDFLIQGFTGSQSKSCTSLRRRYERMDRFPDGLLVLGDAICSFNPVYGQGMSAAALEAVELDKALRLGTVNLASRFFAGAAKIIDIPWNLAAGNDLRMPEVVGPRTPMVCFFNWYVSKLHLGAHHDRSLAMAFQNVINLVAPPKSLLRPRVIARVLSAAFSYWPAMPRRATPTAQPA